MQVRMDGDQEQQQGQQKLQPLAAFRQKGDDGETKRIRILGLKRDQHGNLQLIDTTYAAGATKRETLPEDQEKARERIQALAREPVSQGWEPATTARNQQRGGQQQQQAQAQER